jgi:uncharacterized protein with PIN domain
MGPAVDLVHRILGLPFEMLDLIKHEPIVAAAAVVVVILAVWVARRYQRCPHCHRFVRRVHEGWMRCSRCGRQYHRGLHGVR